MFKFVLLVVVINFSSIYPLPLNITGNSTFSFEDVIIGEKGKEETTNKLIEGIKVPYKLVLMGRQGGTRFNFYTNFYYNKWSKAQFDLLTLDLKNKDINFVLGDSYVRDRPFTIMNQSLRGINLSYTRKIGNTSAAKLRLLGGITKLARDKNSNIADRKREKKETTGIYQRMLYAGILTAEPMQDLFFDFTFLISNDDTSSAKSIDSAGVDVGGIEGINNTIIGSHLSYTFLDQMATVDVDFANSKYTEDITNINDSAKSDNAVQLLARGRSKGVKINLKGSYIGTDFFTGGNSILDVDYMGTIADLGYTMDGMFQTDFSFGFKKDNLSKDTSKITTSTNNFKFKLKSALKKSINGNLFAAFKKDKSDIVEGKSKDKSTITTGAGIKLNLKNVRGRVTLSRKFTDDASILDANDVGTDTTIFNNELYTVSSNIQYRPIKNIKVIANYSLTMNNAIDRDDDSKKTTISNNFYISTESYFKKRTYRPTLDLIYSDNIDKNDASNNTRTTQIKTTLEYRINKTQSAKFSYGFEIKNKKDKITLLDTSQFANIVGLEYTLLF